MNLFYKIIIKLLLYRIAKNFKGDLIIIFPNKYNYILGKNNKKLPYFKILSNFIFIRILFQGELGVSYGYYKGEWTTNNLPHLIRLGIFNLSNTKNLKVKINIFKRIKKIFIFDRSNTIAKSKKQISFHYDLGNNFYRCWLDKTMTYSSGIFLKKNVSLQTAQINKYKSLAELAKINKRNTVLEIGCGWGGFTNYISENIGAKVTGITISKNQYNYAKNIKQKNVIIKLLDYRKINEMYDKIVSIEMFEAVGKKNWNNFFKILDQNLKRKGLAALQIITINERLFERYEKNKDFIQKYIFPGGMLPTKNIIYSLADNNNLHVCKEKCLRTDYAKTLHLWRKNFVNNCN